ncbi:hypothetical protein CCHL11_10173 [Colletotrichum chlorophyti]|uniref:Hydantoinase A/oxoprolinase domain-containing protein n=1 Tax=Colletotrichum chlorophyti TaxID=708187 RepID=A0A1Q8S8J9_9PEZI|nr:hypothetical protein CCHL11_10173 [Colletotrichum chlorophyti]
MEIGVAEVDEGFSEDLGDWPEAPERIVNRQSANISSGVNVDDILIGPMGEASIREQAAIIKSKGLPNVTITIVGIWFSTDKDYGEEDEVSTILRAELGEVVDMVLSHKIFSRVKINLEMPSIEGIVVGGGSILLVNASSPVSVGAESVGHILVLEALCYGGDFATATDVAVASEAKVGTKSVSLDKDVVEMDPCTAILVGADSILCPSELTGVSSLRPKHVCVASAFGEAITKIYGSTETIVY